MVSRPFGDGEVTDYLLEYLGGSEEPTWWTYDEFDDPAECAEAINYLASRGFTQVRIKRVTRQTVDITDKFLTMLHS